MYLDVGLDCYKLIFIHNKYVTEGCFGAGAMANHIGSSMPFKSSDSLVMGVESQKNLHLLHLYRDV